MEVGYVYGGTQTVPNGTNELQEEVVPMLVVSARYNAIHRLPSMHPAPRGVRLVACAL